MPLALAARFVRSFPSLLAALPAAAALAAPPAGAAPLALDAPLGIAAGHGHVWIAELHERRILKLTAAGEPVAAWAPAAAFSAPIALAVDAAGGLYVADLAEHTVTRLAPDGSVAARWGTPGRGPGQFLGPMGVAVGPGGDVYVTDLDNRRVQRFTPDGAPLGDFGGPGTPADLAEPWGVAVDSRGDVLVADHGRHRVVRFDAGGRLLGAWGGLDDPEASLFGPVSVAVGAGDAVYVTDLASHLVQKFSADGEFITQIDREGETPAPVGSLHAVAAEGTRVYVADLARRRFLRFRDETPSRFPRPLPAAFALGGAWPNPTRGAASLALAIPADGRLEVEVYDLEGRRVRTLVRGAVEPGERRVTWDGRDAAGDQAPAGIYFVRARLDAAGAARVLHARLVRLP